MDCSVLSAKFDSGTGRLDVLDAAGEFGWQGLEFYLIVGGRPIVPTADQVRLRVAPSPAGRGWAVTPLLCNTGTAELRFTGYGFRVAPDQPGIRFQPTTDGADVFAHTDNLRYESLPHCRPVYPFIQPLPLQPRHLGLQSQGAMPVLVLGEAGGTRWLVEGALTQRRHLLTWHLGLCPQGRRWADCRSEFTWLGGNEEVVPAGGEMELETMVFLCVTAEPDQLHAAYLKELTALHQFAGRESRLGREPVFCTWNFSVFYNVTEADCQERMARVADVQRGGYFQIDHGYQPRRNGQPPAGALDDYYPDPEGAWDPIAFPSGPRGFVAACRRYGLRPAIWWTPRVARNGVILRDHPEWLLQDEHGKFIDDVGHLMLDFSVPAVREFCENSIRTVTHEWGFEGFKLDFFSYAFDHRAARFRQGGTHLQWKYWLIEMIRRHIGPQGYFLHCVSTPMGNPFYALRGCDAFRGGIDIDRGDWKQHVRCCGWMLPLALASGNNTWFMDLDSCMGKPEIPAGERRSRNALAYITAGMLEFSGPIEKYDEAMLAEYRRLSERCDQGHGLRCPDTAAFYGQPLPRILVREHPADSHTRHEFGVMATIGLFNWTEIEQPIAVPWGQLGLDPRQVTIRDFWSGQGIDDLMPTLPPRGHAIWDVLPATAGA